MYDSRADTAVAAPPALRHAAKPMLWVRDEAASVTSSFPSLIHALVAHLAKQPTSAEAQAAMGPRMRALISGAHVEKRLLPHSEPRDWAPTGQRLSDHTSGVPGSQEQDLKVGQGAVFFSRARSIERDNARTRSSSPSQPSGPLARGMSARLGRVASLVVRAVGQPPSACTAERLPLSLQARSIRSVPAVGGSELASPTGAPQLPCRACTPSG